MINSVTLGVFMEFVFYYDSRHVVVQFLLGQLCRTDRVRNPRRQLRLPDHVARLLRCLLHQHRRRHRRAHLHRQSPEERGVRAAEIKSNYSRNFMQFILTIKL